MDSNNIISLTDIARLREAFLPINNEYLYRPPEPLMTNDWHICSLAPRDKWTKYVERMKNG